MSLAPEIKIAEQRLSVLELAKALGNVSAACKQRGVSRTQFYEYKRRFQTHGIEGLVDLPPVAHSHPAATPPEVEQRILEISLAHPAWGCNRLEAELKLAGISLRSITIQKILNRNEMGSWYDRWLLLEQKHSQQAIELNGEQVAFIEKHNPAFRERHVESAAPGELLCQDTFFVGHLKGVGKVYLHTVVDAYCSVEALQTDLDIWLHSYNYQRPHQGYRNLGKRPFERIDQYLLEQHSASSALIPPVPTEDQPGAQALSRAKSAASLDSAEHRATIDPVTGGNGSSAEVVKVRRAREKTKPTVRDVT